MLSDPRGRRKFSSARQAHPPKVMLTSPGDVGQLACGWRSASGQGLLPPAPDRLSAQCAACRMMNSRRAAKVAQQITEHGRDRTETAWPGRLSSKHGSLQLSHLNCACTSAAAAESLARTSTPLVPMSSRWTGSGGKPAGSGGDPIPFLHRCCLQNCRALMLARQLSALAHRGSESAC